MNRIAQRLSHSITWEGVIKRATVLQSQACEKYVDECNMAFLNWTCDRPLKLPPATVTLAREMQRELEKRGLDCMRIDEWVHVFAPRAQTQDQ